MDLRVPLAGPNSLAARLDEPEGGAHDGTVVLYLHGFGSSQEGEKADLFRRHFLAAETSRNVRVLVRLPPRL